MKRFANPKRRRGTVLLMIVGLLAMLFMLVSAYITLAHFDRVNQRYVTRSAEVDEIMAGIHDLALAQLTRSAADRPGAAVTGANYADIPGYGGVDDNGRQWGSAWLAALEPVVSHRTGQPVHPRDLTYPAVTSFTGGPSGARSMNELMRDYNLLDTQGVINVEPGVFTNPHTVGAARHPWMDADGDGIVDSSFVHVALVNELANAIGGRNVRAPTANPVLLNAGAVQGTQQWTNYNMWQAFDRQARYEAAVRVVSNGGMVMLGNDPAGAWNRQFTRAMLNWVRHPWDRTQGDILVKEPLGSDIEEALDGITRAAGDVEPLLRQRNGLLIGEKGDYVENVPPALATLFQDERLAWTLSPRVMWQVAPKPDFWQRFNLMNAQSSGSGYPDEWSAWRFGATVSGDEYLTLFNPAGTGGPVAARQSRSASVPRRLLTAASYSDDLAREVNPNFTRLKPENPTDPNSKIRNLGIDPGQPKFYLGRLKDAFDGIAFKDTEAGGREIVRQLASYYHEMLSAYNWGPYYDGYNTLVAPPGELNEPPEQKLRSQAFMLAVNTLQFAAPRASDGFMDVVRYTDADAPTDWQRTYYGYGPQPFITQVVVYNKESAPGPGGSESSSLGIAVELYNPNYPNFNESGEDLHALYLPQFALSVSDTFDPNNPQATEQTGLCVLSNELPEADLQWQGPHMGTLPNRMEGQTYRVISLREVGGHQFFDSWLNSQPQLDHGKMVGNGLQGSFRVLDQQGLPTNKIKVKLWRTYLRNQPNRLWHLVDEFAVEMTSTTHKDLTKVAWRDMDQVPYLPADATYPDRAPRWNMVVADDEFVRDVDRKRAPDADDLGGLGNEKHSLLPLSGSAFAPTVMLPLMNVGPDVQWRIHGSYRPGSFPTVGFMLFIPRYCHVHTHLLGSRRPMGKLLYEAWDKDLIDNDGFNYTMPGSGGTRPYPLDFGHMPVFENHQDLAPEADVPSGFHQTGRLPWGLLVFDYFTTINPDGENPANRNDDLDPRRIAGRININAAPWYVLAGLPVIGPVTGWAGDSLPLPTTASPAFWSAAAGVLAGSDANSELRFNPNRIGNATWGMGLYFDRDVVVPGTAGMWRLGPYLALAATAYRDRVAYTTQLPYISGEPRLNFAHQRNNYSNPDMYYRPVQRYGRDTPTGDHIDDNEYTGGIRRQRTVAGTTLMHRGFLSLGELANVMGFDNMVLSRPGDTRNTDFFQAVSLLALLDTHFLTTRSNTYTIYTSLIDREDPQASLRSQVTVDRTRLLPHFVWQDRQRNGDPGYGVMDPPDPTDIQSDLYTIFQETGTPDLIGRRELSYFNARYDN